MSSTRLLDPGLDETETEVGADSWIAVESPVRGRMPSGAGVVVAIAGLRRRYAAGADTSSLVDDSAEYGNGDPELTDAIDRSIAQAWDC